jgi:DNA mismatch repair ATPase MutS
LWSGRGPPLAGPNASGKSCYIKQVACIAYLAHLGCFVPARSATVGIVDRIFTRLVSQMDSMQSTFMSDLSQVQ